MMIKKVLLADDDADDREIFVSIVQRSFPEISLSVATNGQEAMSALQNSTTTPDLIFLDLNMPLMNGRQFLHAIKKDERLQKIPIVILSTSSDKQTILDMKAMGVFDFITKPDKYSVWKESLNNVFTNFQV